MTYIVPILVFATPIALLFLVVIPLVTRNERRKVAVFLPKLAAHGPMTLDEIVAATRTPELLRGYLLEALDDAVDAGRLERTAPPPGHPISRFYRDTRYAVTHRE